MVLLEGANTGPDLAALAHKLLQVIAEPLAVQGLAFLVTGSIGIGCWPADGEDAATLLKHADAAIYLAKERGKNNVQFYTAELADMAGAPVRAGIGAASGAGARRTGAALPAQGGRGRRCHPGTGGVGGWSSPKVC